MPEKPGLGPVQHSSPPVENSTESLQGKEGRFANRKVAKFSAEAFLKGLLKKLPLTRKPLSKYKVTVAPDPLKPSELPRASQAKGVLPEYMPGKVKKAPLLDNVEKQKLLGKGNFGEVHQVTNKADLEEIGETPAKLQKHYVVKDQQLRGNNYQEKSASAEAARKEVSLQKEVAGAPKINREQVLAGRHQAMMEHGGTALSNLMNVSSDPDSRRLGALPIDQARDIGRQLCEQMSKANANGIIHRDIKPDNILINHKGQVTVADFGLADKKAVRQDPQSLEFEGAMGSPQYMAPEVLTEPSYNMKADVWSMGVTLAEMMTGIRIGLVNKVSSPEPYKPGFEPNFKQIDTYRSKIMQHQGLPPEAKSLLLDMLEPNPQNRITFAQAASHPFFARPAKLEDYSYSELQTLHRETFESLARREQELEKMEAVHREFQEPASEFFLESYQQDVTTLGIQLKKIQTHIRLRELKSQARSLQNEIKNNSDKLNELELFELSRADKRRKKSLEKSSAKLNRSLEEISDEITTLVAKSAPVPKPSKKH